MSIMLPLCLITTKEGARFSSTHRSMVAWCTGVLLLPGLTAANGPFLIDCIKAATGTVLLWGLLSRRDKRQFDTYFKPNDNCSSATVVVDSLRVSQLCARRLGVLLRPAVATHTPPAGAGAVHLQDALRRHEAHCGGEEPLFAFPSLASVRSLTKQRP